jgi:hypothetical protein
VNYDYEPREIRSFDVKSDFAPDVGERVTRYRRPEGPEGELVTEYGNGPWEVVEIVPISSRPGWVRVYAVPEDGTSAPWEDDELTPD